MWKVVLIGVSCSSLPINYSPAGYVITDDVNIVNNDDPNDDFKSFILKGPKYREPRVFQMAS